MKKLRKYGIISLNKMLESYAVNDYHKTLLKAIKHNSERNNLSKADIDIFNSLYKQYKNVLNL